MTPGELTSASEALASSGPVRSAAVRVAAARLRTDLHVCRDRSEAIAGAIVDRIALELGAIAGAQAPGLELGDDDPVDASGRRAA